SDVNADLSDALVIFGVTGDLAFKKIFPAIENLERRNRLPPVLVGVARGGASRDGLLARIRESLAKYDPSTDDSALRRIEQKLQFVDGDYHDDATFARLREVLGKAARPTHCLAIPPSLFSAVAEKLGRS